ncbi:N-acetylglucosamine-6-phosphate deacetylase [Microbulbifer sp. OS29]|uniref:N-acetylglucosamine-6-phosphate deacetylase n=1 Tax=Microbulbifer okhotskensis TaxID=2926617 RepID=A0A9X2ELQ3_9GAMM|nr:N-acetylglucosamine-6-phosphate deacetylase [Microbulbifer okhotskensis]MCO1333880.1 N-acetylglucosamine-6-phosphate deacetylase [Microbulbifer okhotskensis]
MEGREGITLLASKLFDGERILTDVAVTIGENGLIGAIGGGVTSSVERLSGLLVPGLVDIQVNGGGGVLFNQDPTLSALQQISEAHAQFGTTAFLPTLITDRLSVMQRAADAVSEALSAGVPGVVGVHFEGPHLSTAKKGTHEQGFIRPLSDEELSLYARDDLGIRLVTLAPESVASSDIRNLVSLGVHVCLGHSNTNAETVEAALSAGATGFTHLFNAMSPLHSREPGMVGTALIRDDAWCGLIADGHHVSVGAIKLALKAKPRGKLLLVTDAMSLVGSEKMSFPLFDRIVTRRGSKLTSSTGELAGSHLDMIGAVRNVHDWCNVELVEVLRMASLYPAQFLGLRAGVIAEGVRANMVLLGEDLQVCRTWIEGVEVYQGD